MLCIGGGLIVRGDKLEGFALAVDWGWKGLAVRDRMMAGQCFILVSPADGKRFLKMARPPIQTWHPSEEEERAFRASDETLQWLLDLPCDAMREYAGKWIAAKDRKVTAVADSLDALLAQLEGSDLQALIIDHIERPEWMVYR